MIRNLGEEHHHQTWGSERCLQKKKHLNSPSLGESINSQSVFGALGQPLPCRLSILARIVTEWSGDCRVVDIDGGAMVSSYQASG